MLNIYMCVCVCLYIYIYIYIYIYTYIHIVGEKLAAGWCGVEYIRTYIHTYIHTGRFDELRERVWRECMALLSERTRATGVSMCMYVLCMYVHVFVYMCVCVCAFARMYACVFGGSIWLRYRREQDLQVCLCVCVYICMYTCVCICTYVCVHVWRECKWRFSEK